MDPQVNFQIKKKLILILSVLLIGIITIIVCIMW